MESGNYFTADDGQVDLRNADYLGIGTLESYVKMREYYGKENVCPVISKWRTESVLQEH